ncbi:MAG TPA: hypothetical protein VLG67_05300, partial [Candidatus Saccharimonadales bacterium]|nr:hypothetical protein [Candidatus Saccharimonadales bacterium]
MPDDLSFISKLGTKDEYLPKGKIIPGSHLDIMLKETLRPLENYASKPDKIPNEFFILATSAPDILPDAGKILLKKASGIWVRGEFLALRALNRSRDEVIKAIAKNSPNIIYYRMMDYHPDEFSFLKDNRKIRGSARLLYYRELLDLEIDTIRLFKKLGKKIRVVLPYITSPAEQVEIQQIIAMEKPDQLGVMVEREEHAENIMNYPTSDFLFPGPSDLVADMKKIDRGEYLEGTSDAKVIALAKKLAVKANKMKIPEFLALKILVNNIKAG